MPSRTLSTVRSPLSLSRIFNPSAEEAAEITEGFQVQAHSLEALLMLGFKNTGLLLMGRALGAGLDEWHTGSCVP